MHRDDFHKGFIVLLVIGFLISPSISSYAQEDIPKSPLADQTWVRLGGPLGGLGYDIRMRPDNPDIMYVTDAWAGVHKSIDGGDDLDWPEHKWQQIGSSQECSSETPSELTANVAVTRSDTATSSAHPEGLEPPTY